MDVNFNTGKVPGQESLASVVRTQVGNTIVDDKAELKNNASKIPPVVQENSKPKATETQKLDKPENQFVSKQVSDDILKDISRANLENIADTKLFSDNNLEVLQSLQLDGIDKGDSEVLVEKINDNRTESESTTRDTASAVLGNLVDTKI